MWMSLVGQYSVSHRWEHEHSIHHSTESKSWHRFRGVGTCDAGNSWKFFLFLFSHYFIFLNKVRREVNSLRREKKLWKSSRTMGDEFTGIME